MYHFENGFWMKRILRKKVYPVLWKTSLNTECLVVNKPKLRIKIAVMKDGKHTFAIHKLTKDKRKWEYTIYWVQSQEDPTPLRMRSSSYPTEWKNS